MNALPPLCVALLLAAALPALAAEPDTVTLCPALNQSSALTKEFSNVEGLQAGKDGWLYANRDLKKAALPTAQTAAYLRRFTQQLEAQNTTLVLALLPSRLLLSARHWPDQHGLPGLERELRAAYQAKRAKLAESGAVVPDLLTPLEAASRQPDAEDFYFSRDHHWTPAGARQTAQVLAPILNNLPALAQRPATTYTTTLERTSTYIGSYARFANKACGLNLPGEPITLYHTRPLQAGLTDDAPALITLAGTSFGLDKYNFAGALSETLHTEVANASVDAGGIDSALTLMLSDPGYAQTRPRVLLWESPDIYSFNMPVLWRQVIPALAGACSEADALASSRVPLAATTPLLSNISAPVTGGKDYLYLHSDSAALTSFTLTLTYADGQQEKVEMERTTRAPNHGHYYLELNPAYSTALTAVSLSAPAPASGQITSRLCRGH